MKHTLSMLVLCLTIAMAGHAQPKTAPSWTAKFGTAINWQRVHALGYVIVNTREALHGLDPETGEILWRNETFGSLDPSLYREIEGTEFITVTYGKEDDETIPMQAIIHAITGKVLFDSNQEGIAVLSQHVLARSGRLLVIGTRPKSFMASLYLYDIATGEQRWKNDDLFKADAGVGRGLLGKLQAVGQQLSNIQSLTSEPVELEDETVIITHPNYVIRLASADGKVLWKNSIEPSTGAQVLFSPWREGVVFVGTNVESESGSGFTSSSSGGEPQKYYRNVYYAFDLETGKPAWKEPAKENDQLNLIIPDKRGLIICPYSSQKPTINLIDYATGETRWGKKGKGIKAQGSVVSHLPTKEGLLITTTFDNAWSHTAEEYYLNILQPETGTLRYEKSIKLKGDLVSAELVPKGLLFITTREINILDTGTGTLVWDNSIESGGRGNATKPFPYGDNGQGSLFVYSPGEKGVFAIDKQAGTHRKITSARIEFEGKELPRAIDVFEDGLVLSSAQNVMKIGFDGQLKYARYYPAPRQPALMRALLAADAIRTAYIGAAAAAYSASFAGMADNADQAATASMGRELSAGFGNLANAGFRYSAQAFRAFNARFKASRNTPEFVMIMTRQEKRGNQLIQVSKSTGDITSAIDIKNDREPEYDVDPIYNFVYYRPALTEIACYKL